MTDEPTRSVPDATAADPALPPALAELAELYGVATSYLDNADQLVRPPTTTIRAVLAAMDVPCANAGDVDASLRAARDRRRRRRLAPTVVLPAGGGRSVPVDVRSGEDLVAEVELERGGRVAAPIDRPHPGADPEVLIPASVPVGEHRLVLRSERGDDAAQSALLLVVPDRCPMPTSRSWGWQVQLYAARSTTSWGIGDLADLADLAAVAGREHGADFVLLNPLHAAAPVVPHENSPYSPSTRRAFDPIYLRPERCDGWSVALDGAEGRRLRELDAEARELNRSSRIDRDAAFAVKDEALRIVHRAGLRPERQASFEEFRARPGIEPIALGMALTLFHGPDSRRWPARDDVDDRSDDQAREVEYQLWLQWQLDEQLAAAQLAATDAGMAIGLITDLAVGVDAAGVDVWSLGRELAPTMSVGAPPDPLAQLGQDWGLPPLRPDRLAEDGYRAFREIIRANVRRAGGLRIDHVLALWRLFWIPRGRPASEGTYVRYDPEAMLGVLALEAERAGAVVVGEDLGTVEEGVRPMMADRGVLGSAVFWFERPSSDAGTAEEAGEAGEAENADRPAAIGEYRSIAMTSVTTHDLPTVAGWFAGEPTRIRAALDQLASDLATERRRSEDERDRLLDQLVRDGALDPADRSDPEQVAAAIHAFVGRTPSLLVSVGLADAVGDLRQPNLPGTIDEYPNWRLPIAVPDPEGDDAGTDGLLPPSTPILLDELLADDRVRRLAEALTAARRRPVS